ncbi:DUF898 family protein [Massilia dura]|uniref:DUF898 family protein n=2 Tax=Pseudoduganella dura TaxID=321982 RepID=A0A6I3XR47_9BURK|nr:DUF898 family protein [Pseudoduganella dura]
MLSGAAVPQAEPQVREERFVFTATGGEYFRIWIVNLLLTVVTLGIYSAWAKVRRNQYLYSNTRLASGGFEYHGLPIAILKGRIVAGVLFGGYYVAAAVSPVAALAVFAVLMGVMPWLIWKGLQFALHNSSYRGIRFGFDGSARGAYFHYLVLPLLAALTLGLLYPFVHQRIKRFQHTHSRYGSVPFSFDAPVSGFYKRYLVMALVLFGGLGLSIVAAGLLVSALGVPVAQAQAAGAMIGLFLVYPYLLCVLWIFYATLQNLIWNHTQLGPHRFRSTMKAGRIASIYITNTLAILFTLGLFIPFATVRAMKYRLECTSLLVAGSLDDIAAGQRAEIGAIGDGAADLGGFDLAL